LNNVVVRGTVYATAGQIGGNTIDSTSIHSGTTGYGTGAGFYLGSDGRFSLSNKLTWDGTTLTVTGNVSGGQFTTGAYTGYAWPAAGNYGTYLGPGGLLIGNANNGKYLQVTQDGNIYAPGLTIENGSATFSGALSAASGTFRGTLTADAVNAVNTLNIAGEAVTVPRYGSNFPFSAVGSTYEKTLITLPSITITTGAVVVQMSVTGYETTDTALVWYPTFYIRRNGVNIWSKSFIGAFSVSISDIPGGSAVYSLYMTATNQYVSFSDATLVVIGCKK